MTFFGLWKSKIDVRQANHWFFEGLNYISRDFFWTEIIRSINILEAIINKKVIISRENPINLNFVFLSGLFFAQLEINREKLNIPQNTVNALCNDFISILKEIYKQNNDNGLEIFSIGIFNKVKKQCFELKEKKQNYNNDIAILYLNIISKKYLSSPEFINDKFLIDTVSNILNLSYTQLEKGVIKTISDYNITV